MVIFPLFFFHLQLGTLDYSSDTDQGWSLEAYIPLTVFGSSSFRFNAYLFDGNALATLCNIMFREYLYGGPINYVSNWCQGNVLEVTV